MGDVAAAWQNPPQTGEEGPGSRAMSGCHVRNDGMTPHNAARWQSELPDARRARLCSRATVRRCSRVQ